MMKTSQSRTDSFSTTFTWLSAVALLPKFTPLLKVVIGRMQHLIFHIGEHSP